MNKRVVLIGGSGFVGKAIANRLSEEGFKLVVPTRRRSRAAHLLVLPTIEVVEADVFDPKTLAQLLSGADAVVNLVGVLHSKPGTPYGPDFARAHVELPKLLAETCASVGVPRLVHISALGASAEGPSEYQRSKAAGEAAITAQDAPEWTILRPSVIFGRDDSFLNLFAGLARLFPVLPLAGAGARFQPVYVEDVARAVLHCLTHHDTAGQIHELAGPHTYTLKELVEYVCQLVGKKRFIYPLSEGMALMQARLMELAPTPLMSRDNVLSMRADNVASGAPMPFGLEPTPLEAVAPAYIGNQCVRGGYYESRHRARRSEQR